MKKKNHPKRKSSISANCRLLAPPGGIAVQKSEFGKRRSGRVTRNSYKARIGQRWPEVFVVGTADIVIYSALRAFIVNSGDDFPARADFVTRVMQPRGSLMLPGPQRKRNNALRFLVR
jgi:hypothetical protein